MFNLLSGTRLGGLMSASLYAIFINDVIVKLEVSGFGHFIRNLCFNAFMYADDLLLLSISVSDLQKMLNICLEELNLLDMNFNVNKSNWLRIGKRHNSDIFDDIFVNNKVVKRETQHTYLGIYNNPVKKHI